jgi:hypothetical protein
LPILPNSLSFEWLGLACSRTESRCTPCWWGLCDCVLLGARRKIRARCELLSPVLGALNGHRPRRLRLLLRTDTALGMLLTDFPTD